MTHAKLMASLLILIGVLFLIFGFLYGLNSNNQYPSISAIIVTVFAFGIPVAIWSIGTSNLGAAYFGLIVLFICATIFIPPILGYWLGFILLKGSQYLEQKLNKIDSTE